MRVIRASVKEIRMICPHCKSLLGYLREDVHTHMEEYDGDLHWHNYITCPVCNKKIILEVDGDNYL